MGKDCKLIKKILGIFSKTEIAFNRGLEIQIKLLLKEIGIFSAEINSHQIKFMHFFNHKEGC